MLGADAPWNQRFDALHGFPTLDDQKSCDQINLFPDASSLPTHTLLEYLLEIEEAPPPRIERFVAPSGTWAEPAEIPKELSRALALCGNFDPVTKSWSIGDLNASFINDWLGVQQETESSEGAAGPDPEQQRVIEAPANLRLVVEAGPGSGKTYVACARITSLVERGEVVPSRVLVLSFTRVAVAELRDRVAAVNSSTATPRIHMRTCSLPSPREAEVVRIQLLGATIRQPFHEFQMVSGRSSDQRQT